MAALTNEVLPEFAARLTPAELEEFLSTDSLAKQLHAHRLLIVEGAEPSDELVTRIAHSLGEPQLAFPAKARVEGHPHIKHQVAGRSGNYDAAYWHQDRNFGVTPARATILQCHEAPVSGGETPMVDAVATLAALDDETKQVLRNWTGVYEFGAVADAAEERQFSDSADLGRLRDFTDRVILTHPVTGWESISLAERYVRIETGGHQLADSRSPEASLVELIEDGVIHRHCWQVGDILIWDNYATLHRGEPLTTPDTTKITHRIVVN